MYLMGGKSMKTVEEKAREAYLEHMPSINTYQKIFEDLKGKLAAISLAPEEEVLLCTEIFGGSKYGMLLATDKKLIHIKPAYLAKEVQYLSYGKIQTVEYKKTIMKSDINIHMVDGEKLNLFHSKANVVTEVLNDIMDSYRNGSFTKKDAPIESKALDVIGRIQELFEMKEKGILTTEEFDLLKKNLISNQ